MVRLPDSREEELYYRYWRLPPNCLYEILDEKVDFSKGRCLVFADTLTAANAMYFYLKLYLNKSNVVLLEPFTHSSQSVLSRYMYVANGERSHLTPILRENNLPSWDVRMFYFSTAETIVYLQNSWIHLPLRDCITRFSKYMFRDCLFFHFGLYPVVSRLTSFESRRS